MIVLQTGYDIWYANNCDWTKSIVPIPFRAREFYCTVCPECSIFAIWVQVLFMECSSYCTAPTFPSTCAASVLCRTRIQVQNPQLYWSCERILVRMVFTELSSLTITSPSFLNCKVHNSFFVPKSSANKERTLPFTRFAFSGRLYNVLTLARTGHHHRIVLLFHTETNCEPGDYVIFSDTYSQVRHDLAFWQKRTSNAAC